MNRLSLQQKPEIHHVGIGNHGQNNEENYLLPTLWCLHLYSYTADLWVDGNHYAITPGRISLVPPGAALAYLFRGPSQHLFAHFRVPEPGLRPNRFQIMTDEPRITPRIREGLYEVVRRMPANRLRAEILLWDLLWELASVQPDKKEEAPAPHPVFVQAREQIEVKLGEPFSVSGLARTLGISHNQLTRVFRKETGDTVAAYIQTRRAKRAQHLLKDTSLPIKSIGIQVGYVDPHHFNKFIHRTLGKSPTAIREGR
jgi:AraC-like DNA-binding protein